METPTRSLKDLAQEKVCKRIYLAKLQLSQKNEAILAEELGLHSYPPESTQAKLYRYLGHCEEHLDCESTTLIRVQVETRPVPNSICPDDEVLVALIPYGTHIPYIDLGYGPSLLERPCNCHKPEDAEDYMDDMGELIGMVDKILREIVCNSFLSSSNRCRNSSRCHDAFRALREFLDRPERDTVQNLSNWIHDSSMREQCMRAIVEYSRQDWGKFIGLIAAILL